MTESDVYKKLYNMLHPLGWMLQRIECGAFAPSVPDVWIKPPGYEDFWCELKVVPSFATDMIRPKWRPGQLAWARRCLRAGGEWRVIIGASDTRQIGWAGSPCICYESPLFSVTPERIVANLTLYG